MMATTNGVQRQLKRLTVGARRPPKMMIPVIKEKQVA